MAIHIANPEVDALVRTLAARRGVTIRQAVHEAVVELLVELDPAYLPGPLPKFRKPPKLSRAALKLDQPQAE